MSKISLFVSDEKINYLPNVRQIIDLRDSDKSLYFAITSSNNCFIIRSLILFCNEYRSIFTQERSQEGFFLSSVVSFTHEQNIIRNQTQLDDIAHEETTICRQLFTGHVVGSQPMKR